MTITEICERVEREVERQYKNFPDGKTLVQKSDLAALVRFVRRVVGAETITFYCRTCDALGDDVARRPLEGGQEYCRDCEGTNGLIELIARPSEEDTNA